MKHLKTFLFFEGNQVAESTVIQAAIQNTNLETLGLNGLFAFAITLKTMGRHEDTQVEKIGENKLHIDAKINGKWENVLIVEEVEVFETVLNDYEDEDLKTDILAASKYPLNESEN